MKWTPEADESIQKVPFFVRKRVRARVEKEAKDAAKKVITLADVKTTQARYLTGMASEIKGLSNRHLFRARRMPEPGGRQRSTPAENRSFGKRRRFARISQKKG